MSASASQKWPNLQRLFRPFLPAAFPLSFRADVEASRARQQIKRWSEYGEFQNIADAAERILELEGAPNGALFFRIYVDPNPLTAEAVTGTTDAKILSRLEYQSEKGFYLVERTVS